METYCRYIWLALIILVAATHQEAMAAKHVVGGSGGWDESVDFDTWASGQTFRVGDQLEFKYTAMHSVVELPNESAYKSCSTGGALNSLNGGSNTVKLDKPGTRFFACGTSGHCDQGMKVKITTVAAAGAPSSSSTATTDTPSSSSTTTTDTPSTQAATSNTYRTLQFFSFFTLFCSLVLSLVHI